MSAPHMISTFLVPSGRAPTLVAIDSGKAFPVRPNIYVISEKAPPFFLGKVFNALAALERTPTGRRLLEKIGRTAHSIIITYRPEEPEIRTEEWRDAVVRGKGCGSFINYNGENLEYLSTTCASVPYPSFVMLGHELIHAYHFATGKDARNGFRCDRLVWTQDEEYHTIMGFPSKNPIRTRSKITENAILSELGLPERFGHYGIRWLQNNRIQYQRMQLAAEVYRRFCATSNYGGQLERPPPPILNCTRADLGPSTRIAILYRMMMPGSSADKDEIPIFGDMGDGLSDKLDDDFVRLDFDGDNITPQMKLQNFPSFATSPLLEKSIGIYRLSLLEARELEILNAKADKKKHTCTIL